MRRKVPDIESVIRWTSAIAAVRRDWLTADMTDRYSPRPSVVGYDIAAMDDGTFAVLPEMWHPGLDDGTFDEVCLARLSTFADAEAYVITLARMDKGIDLLTP